MLREDRRRLLTCPPEQAAEKLKTLSFLGALRAEESLFSCALNKEGFLASLGMTNMGAFSVGMTIKDAFSAACKGER
jgi:hypothetical protein